MKHLRKWNIRTSGLILVLCLFISLTMTSTYQAKAEAGKVLGSAQDKGITLSVNQYAIINHGQELVVYYTVETSSAAPNHDVPSLIHRPDFSIGDRLVQGQPKGYKKISSQKYAGTLKVDLPQYRPAVTNVELRTDTILNQKGQWTVGFKIGPK
ncbi:hypothetical protein ACFO4N_12475 [Camelliibacillus cellulosilyticus]|uniref:Uncharacterized protein n=1 Tax=Camelliibacillus cellulosilyticus TaxID=2174486 RepID=A0ABV9GNI5_9BACL